jgi:hexosaminidase
MNPTANQNHLMPVPANVHYQSGRLPIDSSFSVSTDSKPDPRMTAAVQRMVRRLEGRTTITIPTDLKTDTGSKLLIHCKKQSAELPRYGQDESYTLEISPTQAVLSANETVGVLRGLETFLQLVDSDQSGYYVPAVSIQDSPRFPWRGLLVDVGRHYEPVEIIKRTLDGMASVKMNVLHWHLTEDQGFRIESKKFPKLAEMGSDGLFYTQEQVKDVIAYAAERGIRVMPEFDMPAHTTAWFVAYPEYASAPGPYQIERGWGVFDPTMNPTDERVYKFLDEFLGEMSKLFPDEYIHIGGDESTGRQWDNNPGIQEFKKKHDLKDNAALQTYFNQRVQKILEKHGKKVVGWDEVLNPELPKDVVVESWRGDKALGDGAKQGYQGILAAPFYLDLIRPTSQHYLGDPLPANTDLTPEQQKLVLGGEACMWSEHVTSDSIESRIWPRLAAVAERLWSPGSVRDVDDMYRRMARVSVQLEELGITHESQTARMLRRMVQGHDIGPLLVFASTVQPATADQRNDQHPTQLTPYTHLADAVVPDPPAGRQLQALVDKLMIDPDHKAGAAELTVIFNHWKSSVPAVMEATRNYPVLAEVAPRVQEYDQLAQMGLDALNYVQTRQPAPAGWLSTNMNAIEQMGKTKGLVRFVVLEPMYKLVRFAANAPATPPPAPVSE